jgi:hypothetical protein
MQRGLFFGVCCSPSVPTGLAIQKAMEYRTESCFFVLPITDLPCLDHDPVILQIMGQELFPSFPLLVSFSFLFLPLPTGSDSFNLREGNE